MHREFVRKAIVLRNYYPERNVLSLLDEHLGRTEVLCYKKKIAERICHGAFIEYRRERKRSFRFVVEDIECIEMPFWWAHNDFLFFHQLLEIAQIFAPLDGCTPELFEFVCRIYQEKIECSFLKRILLCRFLYLVGIVSDEAIKKMPSLFSLISSPQDIILVSEEIDEQMLEELEKWLKCCLTSHPYAQKLKTLTCLL